VVLLAAGCGRLAFDDASSSGDGGAADAPRPCLTPVGHDEDADSIDDACDVCPHLVDDQRDSDGDGVGDACDPDPASGRQSIAYFDPLIDQRAGWSKTANTTVSATGVVTDASPNTYADYGRAVVDGTDVFVTGGTISAGNKSAGFHISILLRDAGTPEFYCELFEDTGVPRLMLTYSLDGSSFPHDGRIDLGIPTLVGTSGTLALSYDASSVRCDATWGGQTVSTSGPRRAIVPTTVRLVAVSSTAQYDYFLQIHSQ
jgi:hypothetical protein